MQESRAAPNEENKQTTSQEKNHATAILVHSLSVHAANETKKHAFVEKTDPPPKTYGLNVCVDNRAGRASHKL